MTPQRVAESQREKKKKRSNFLSTPTRVLIAWGSPFLFLTYNSRKRIEKIERSSEASSRDEKEVRRSRSLFWKDFAGKKRETDDEKKRFDTMEGMADFSFGKLEARRHDRVHVQRNISGH